MQNDPIRESERPRRSAHPHARAARSSSLARRPVYMGDPYTVTARPDTGLWNAKVGIWLFLASEVMLFGGLFSAYVFRLDAAPGAWPHGL